MGLPFMPFLISASTISYGLYELYKHFEWEGYKDQIKEKMSMDPIELPNSISEQEYKELEYRPFYVDGTFQHEREMKVYPKFYDNQSGLHLYTPLLRPDGYVYYQ